MVTGSIRSIRNRRRLRSQFSEEQEEYRRMLYGDDRPPVILSGPFQNMKYINDIVWGPITPKWLGCYEAELHEIVDEIVSRHYSTVIDLGCAEGYYAVGLAYAMPDSRVHAFDVDFISRRQAKALAELNGLQDRVSVRGYCRHEDIEALVDDRTLLVCDIEGFETEMLDPEKAGELRKCDILVELHRLPNGAGMTGREIAEWFDSSHEIQFLKVGGRQEWIDHHRKLFDEEISPHEINRAVCEYRDPKQEWMWLKQRSN